ncbi:MAG TPA: radical SAM family heme chaperone HemW [Planctomycetota bacterium]|nr:radical SAM family heme chaperone HemW [Planctomycetota bacterium]
MANTAPRHLYLHVPYCAAKCPYCDFNSIAGRDAEHAAYVDALIAEVRRLPRGPYDTVFIGGGTPTLLGTALLARLLAGVRDHLLLAEGYEWTCEANPGSSDAERFAVLAEHGVNRLSLGVQSTHDHHLKFLGRVHDAREADRAIDLARRAVPRVSADLIMGLPGQTDEELRQDLTLYRRHDLSHASVYHLTYEPGTEFHARRARGELRDITPEDSRRQFDLLWDAFAALGLAAYETSNFARAGEASRHNLAYWRQNDYHAAGAGAVSTVAGVRVTREKHPAAYITAIATGNAATWRSEEITSAARLRETWMLGLRLTEGVSLMEVAVNGDLAMRWRPRADALITEGLIEERAGHLSLTRAGRPVQDEVTVYLMP